MSTCQTIEWVIQAVKLKTMNATCKEIHHETNINVSKTSELFSICWY